MKIHTFQYYTLLFCTLAVGLLSCDRQYEPVFNESAETRMQAALDEYNATLQAAPHGWKASLVTASGIEYFYYFEFESEGRVNMLSDFNATTAGTVQTSTWELRPLQSATLSFPLYSYIHLPADPDGNVNGGPDGVGRESDFEFAFARSTADSILLEGIQRGARMTFIKATAAERQQVLGGRIKEILAYGLGGNGLRMTLSGDRNVTFALNPDRKRLTGQYISDDGLRVEVAPTSYAVSMNGIVLGIPIHAYGQTIRELLWDDADKSYYIKTAAGDVPVQQDPDLYFFKPAIPVQDVLGNDFFAMIVPYGSVQKPIKGQSAMFIELYKTAIAGMAAVEPSIDLYDMFMAFDVETNTMYLVVRVIQNDQVFNCQYNYRYTLSADGIYTFTPVSANDNANAIRSFMGDILYYIEASSFQAEFVGATEALTAGFFSQEYPDFSVSGELTN